MCTCIHTCAFVCKQRKLMNLKGTFSRLFLSEDIKHKVENNNSYYHFECF
ncbi:mCG148312 [Mus musculus]|nr:mCG148312 [Mus musculus]